MNIKATPAIACLISRRSSSEHTAQVEQALAHDAMINFQYPAAGR
jgi:hypothetical protein